MEKGSKHEACKTLPERRMNPLSCQLMQKKKVHEAEASEEQTGICCALKTWLLLLTLSLNSQHEKTGLRTP